MCAHKSVTLTNEYYAIQLLRGQWQSIIFVSKLRIVCVETSPYLHAILVHIDCAIVDRKRKMEEHLHEMTWKINYSDIAFAVNEGGIAVKGIHIYIYIFIHGRPLPVSARRPSLGPTGSVAQCSRLADAARGRGTSVGAGEQPVPGCTQAPLPLFGSPHQ